MAKVKGLDFAKELQNMAQDLANQVSHSVGKAQDYAAQLSKMEIKLVQKEVRQAQQAAEAEMIELEKARASAAAAAAEAFEQADISRPGNVTRDEEPAATPEPTVEPAEKKAEPTEEKTEIKAEINTEEPMESKSVSHKTEEKVTAPALEKPAKEEVKEVKAEVKAEAKTEVKAEAKPEANKKAEPQQAAKPAAPAGRDFLKANRPPMPKNMAAFANQKPQQQGNRPFQPRNNQQGENKGQWQQRPGNMGDRQGQGQGGNRPFQQRNNQAGQQQGGNRPFQPRNNQGGGKDNFQDKDRPQTPRFTPKPKPQAPDIIPVMEKERVSNYDPNKNSYQRVYDVERKAPKAKKDVFKENIAKSGGLDDEQRFRKQRSGKKQDKAQTKIETVKIDHAVMTTEMITVKDLTEKLGKPAGEIIKRLFMLGIMATINNEIDFDTANLVAQEFDIELEYKPGKTLDETITEAADSVDNEEDLIIRPPVVTIMGHVDHGKTSLLDKIRSTSVTKTEAGGITQHIGAYTVMCDGRQITFLDTPGHEAFTTMRARGAQTTDIAILVVAADDGIMPQTVESINHAKAANVPIIVAVNKMDKPTANPDKIMQQLTEYELVPEEWGGSTIVTKVSALTGDGIDNLLEMILLVADVNEYKANPNRQAKGVIIEAKLDKGRGPVATVLVQNGTLRVGDAIVAGTAYGRIRAMINDKGKRIDEAGPSTPVEVIGFGEVPNAGDILNVVDDDRLSRLVAEERRDKLKAAQLKAASKVTLDDLFNQISTGDIKELNVIIKADVMGSVEAVKQSVEKLSTPEVKVHSIHGGVGAINETDVMLASASNAIIIGFNVRPDALARTAAEREKVDIRLYRVIYNAIEDITAAIKGMLAPKFREIVLGHAQVRQTFRVSGVGTIAGAYVTDGTVRRNASVRLLRDNVVIFEGKLSSLKRFKDDAREVATGYECGIGLENYNDVKENDVIECFIDEQIEN